MSANNPCCSARTLNPSRPPSNDNRSVLAPKPGPSWPTLPSCALPLPDQAHSSLELFPHGLLLLASADLRSMLSCCRFGPADPLGPVNPSSRCPLEHHPPLLPISCPPIMPSHSYIPSLDTARLSDIPHIEHSDKQLQPPPLQLNRGLECRRAHHRLGALSGIYVPGLAHFPRLRLLLHHRRRVDLLGQA